MLVSKKCLWDSQTCLMHYWSQPKLNFQRCYPYIYICLWCSFWKHMILILVSEWISNYCCKSSNIFAHSLCNFECFACVAILLVPN